MLFRSSKMKYGKYSALAKVKENHYQVRRLVPGKKVYFKVASVLHDNYDREFTITSVNTENISKSPQPQQREDDDAEQVGVCEHLP